MELRMEEKECENGGKGREGKQKRQQGIRTT